MALNFDNVDRNLLKNANMFRYYSFIPKDEINNKKLN